MTIENWLESWYKLSDPKEKQQFIESLPKEFENDPRIAAIKAWFDVRYFFADKGKTRLGDNFIWLYLSMYGQEYNRTGQKEMLRIYRKIFDSPEGIKAAALSKDELKHELKSAADAYISTMGEPSPLFGIIPRKDKTPANRKERISKLILDKHIKTLWNAGKDLEYAPLIAQTLYNSTKYHLEDVTDVMAKSTQNLDNDEFKEWVINIRG